MSSSEHFLQLCLEMKTTLQLLFQTLYRGRIGIAYLIGKRLDVVPEPDYHPMSYSRLNNKRHIRIIELTLEERLSQMDLAPLLKYSVRLYDRQFGYFHQLWRSLAKPGHQFENRFPIRLVQLLPSNVCFFFEIIT